MNLRHRLRWRASRPTLRLRLALWSGELVLLANVLLALLINIGAIYVPPQAIEGPGQLQVISVISLLLVTVVTGVGAYWMAGRALQPLRKVSRTAGRVSAGTLHTRLALETDEAELSELTRAFDTMLDRLEHAFAQQGEFVANAAHELRTPLATLRTNLEITQADPKATLRDYREMVHILEKALGRMERLVEGLLILASEEEVSARESVNLLSLIGDVLHDLRPTADERRVSLYLAACTDVVVRGNGLLLERVFINLIENGIRYNREGGEVTVSVHKDGAQALVTVADTGVGIPIEEQAHIFDRFYRVDRSRSRHRGGAGLGLAIVMHVVHLHGGQVSVTSAPGVGSKFTVRLPLSFT